ncbi:MAG: glycogen debranching N-terminal domain-containing protein, partial [Vicinamibacterales bacterium]
MTDIIQIDDVYYVRATSSMADGRTNVLKHGETFAVFDRNGDIQPAGMPESGIFHDGTRFLSSLTLGIDNQRLLPLNSAVEAHNFLLNVDLTNAEIVRDGQIAIPQETLHVHRCTFLWRGACYERITLTNYGNGPCDFTCDLAFDADFADIFEVRGTLRSRRGLILPPEIGADRVRLSYQGLDDLERHTT